MASFCITLFIVETSKFIFGVLWSRRVVVITAAQHHTTKSELRFCEGSNHACDVSEIPEGEDAHNGPGSARNKAKDYSSVGHTTKAIHHHHHIPQF